jgi:hypothetical protein
MDESAVRRDCAITNAAWIASAPHQEVDVMRTRMTHDPSGLEEPETDAGPEYGRYMQARYAGNMVASMLMVVNTALGPEYAEPKHLAEIEVCYSAALDSGLQGVSPTVRTHIVNG